VIADGVPPIDHAQLRHAVRGRLAVPSWTRGVPSTGVVGCVGADRCGAVESGIGRRTRASRIGVGGARASTTRSSTRTPASAATASFRPRGSPPTSITPLYYIRERGAIRRPQGGGHPRQDHPLNGPPRASRSVGSLVRCSHKFEMSACLRACSRSSISLPLRSLAQDDRLQQYSFLWFAFV
jgi:hypothetical protein